MEFLHGFKFYDGHTQKRTINPNVNVDKNKADFCMAVGYTNQEKVCEYCGSKKYCDANREAAQQLKIDFINDDLY
jgi:hypothetical protein